MGRSSTASGGSLVFLETQAQVSRARSLLRRHGPQIKVVALSPEAMNSLDDIGHAYTIPEDYCDLESLREVGERNYPRTEELCGEIDRALANTLSILTGAEAPPLTHTHFHELKILVDAVSTRAFGIRRLLEREKPAAVWSFRTKPQPLGDTLDFDHESLYSLIIPWVCQATGIPFTSLGTMKVSFPTRDIALWKRLIYAVAGMQNVSRFKIGLSMRRHRLRAETGGQDRRRILLLNVNRELLSLVERCRERGIYDFVLWNDRPSSVAAAPRGRDSNAPDRDPVARLALDAHSIWEDIGTRDKLQKHFVFDGIDCWPIVESRVRHLVTRCLPATFGAWRRGRDLFHGASLHRSC